MKKQCSRKTKKIMALAASAATLVLLFGASAWAYYTPYTYVSLDVNPSIEYSLNMFDHVLSVTPVNTDGEQILESIDLDSLKNMPIQDAIAVTVDQISQEGYFDADTEGGIIVATSAEDEEKAEELAQELQETIEQQNQDNGDTVEVEAISVGLERVQKARELGVTPGKLNLVEKLQASATEPESINVEEWLNKPVKDIMKATKENKKAAKIGAEDDVTPIPTDPEATPDAVPSPTAGQAQQQNASDKAIKAQEKAEQKAQKSLQQAEKKQAQKQEQEQEQTQDQEQEQAQLKEQDQLQNQKETQSQLSSKSSQR